MADTGVPRGASMPEMRGNPKATVPRRRRRRSAGAEKNIEDDVLMASAIGDVAWLQQSLRDSRKVYAHSKQHGLAPIHLAAQNCRLDCIRTMIERYKVDVNLQSETGWTPLHLAISKTPRSLRCTRYLLEKGADPSLPNHAGFTPVHQAASEGHMKCLEALIKAGAKIDGIDNAGYTPMKLTQIWGHRNCARVLANRQWYIDKEKELEERLAEETQARKIAEDMQRLSLLKKVRGQNDSQLAYKNWLEDKKIPDIPTMYGPIPTEERKLAEESTVRKSRSCTPALVVTESSVVVHRNEASTFEQKPSITQYTSYDYHNIDSDKKLELIPLESISASKRRKGQRLEFLQQAKPRIKNSSSPKVR